MFISVEGTDNNQLEPSQGNMGHAPVLLHCSLLRNAWPKPTGMLEHFHLLVLHFLGRLLLTSSLRRQRMSMYISLLTVTIHVNSTSEFRELLKLLRIIITVALQLNFVYCMIKNSPFKNRSFRSLCLRPRIRKEKKCYNESIR